MRDSLTCIAGLIVVVLIGAAPAFAADAPAAGTCTTPAPPLDLDGPAWRGWGNDAHNSRYQPDPGLTAEEVPRLMLKWVYRYDVMAVGQPVIVDGWIFAGGQTGHVIALDAATGCLRWTHGPGPPARTAISLGALPTGAPARIAAWYADDLGFVHAVNAETGAEIWTRQLDTHVATRITGAPLFDRGRLYVPVSSAEEGWAKTPAYPCCTFRGSVVALDAATGSVIWRAYTIDEPPHLYHRQSDNAQRFGPAGAAVWSAPTLDERRGLLYVATGNSYTDVPEHGSDAIVAIDIATGRIVWTNQLRTHDNYVVPCLRAAQAGEGNCPSDLGPDFDFGSSAVLAHVDGHDVLLAGQKSGTLFALDPDQGGRKLWETSVGAGSSLGGIQWGFAVDDSTAFVPVADPYPREGGPPPRPGVYAVRIADGALLWQWPAPIDNCAWLHEGRCFASNSAATTVIPGVVFAGASDGHLRAYRAGDGTVIWDFDTAGQPYDAVNGGQARGGSIDNGGPVVAGGILLVNSGYGRLIAHGGNALMAFTPDGR